MRCINALIGQNFPKAEYEVIVVSDGHDASSYNAVGRFNTRHTPHVKYFNLPKKGGPAAARNRGWQQAIGELIAFTDDDCIPDSNWLASLWNHYIASGLSEMAISGRTIVPIPKIPTDYERNISNLQKAEFITANCACTRKALMKVGGLDERFTMAWREDSDLQFKLILKGVKILQAEDAIVTHPVRKAKWGISIREEKKSVFNALLFKKYPKLYKEKIQRSRPWLYYFAMLCFLIFIAGLIMTNLYLAVAGLTGWILATVAFAWKRLASTQKTFSHVTEMLVTSMFIPILAVYYRIYGSIKYGVLMIP